MVTVIACPGTSASGLQMPLVDLLSAARRVELDHLDVQRVVEVGDTWVVEGQVAVLADAETAEVERVRGQQFAVVLALRCGIGTSVQVVGRPRVGRLLDSFPDPAPEAGRVVGSEPHVLVHVEDHHVTPRDVRRRGRRGDSRRRPAGSCRWRTWRGPRRLVPTAPRQHGCCLEGRRSCQRRGISKDAHVREIPVAGSCSAHGGTVGERVEPHHGRDRAREPGGRRGTHPDSQTRPDASMALCSTVS